MERLGIKVWLALATIYVVWGSTFAAVSVAVRDLPPLFAMALRHLVAGSILLAWSLPRREGEADRLGVAQWRSALVFGGALFLIGHGGLAWAQQTIPSGVAALLIGSIPLWMALIDRVFFGRLLKRPAAIGLVAGFVGLAFLVDPFGEGSVDRLGALVAVLAALSWAAGSLYSRGAPLPVHPLVAAGLAALCGGALLAGASAARGELAEVKLDVGSLVAVGYLTVFGSLIGFTAYVWLLRAAPTSLVSTYAYMNPIIAVLLGWALLGEEVTAGMLVAGAAIVASVALILSSGGEAPEKRRGLLRRRAPARQEQ